MQSKPIILAVDGMTDSLALLVKVLTLEGYHVLPADSGELALTSIASHLPDLILLDIRMQDMSGLEVCRQLKAQEKTKAIPIIMISAIAEPQEWIDGFRLGAVDYVSKPFRTKELLARVKIQLQLSQVRVALEEKSTELIQANQQMTEELIERKIMEDSLRESEERFRMIFESSDDAILETTVDGNVITANPAACRILMRTEAEICKDNRKGLVDQSDPRLASALAKREKTGRFREELTLLRGNGETFEAEVTSVIYKSSQGQEKTCIIFRDITNRNLVEVALRASEVKYRRLFESAKDGILILDSETGMIEDVNPYLMELLGYTHEAFLGKKIWELGFFKDLIANEVNFLELQQKEYVRYENMPLETVDGRKIEVEFVSNVYLVDNKKVIQCNIRNITERVVAEKALRISENQYRRLFESAKDGILILDAETGMIVDVNQFLVDLLGFSHEVFLGKRVWELGFFKDIIANQENFMELQQNEYVRYENMPLETADKRTIDVEFVSNVYLVNNKKVIQCNIRDISIRMNAIRELKHSDALLRQSEERYSKAFQTSPYAIAITHPETSKFIEVNDAFYKITGYSKEEVFGNSSLGLDLWVDTEERKRIVETLRAGNAIVGREVVFKVKGGRNITCLFSAQIVKINNEQLILSSIDDITELKQLTTQRIRLEQELNKQFHLSQVGLLASGITHNLRSPLGIITMQASLMQLTLNSQLESTTSQTNGHRSSIEQTLSGLDNILLGTTRIEEIINEIMQYHLINSKDSSGIVDLNQIIMTDTALLKADLDLKHNIQFTVSLHDSPLHVHAKGSEIGQCFLNLVSNARDALFNIKHRVINISSGKTESEKTVWFSVHDNGCGILPDALARLGEPFYTTKGQDETAKGHGSGTGLGIYSIKQILNKHGGKLNISSVPGETTFTVVLPESVLPVNFSIEPVRR